MSVFSGEPQSSLSWEGDPCVWVREGETEARSGLGTRGAGAGVNTALWEYLGSQAEAEDQTHEQLFRDFLASLRGSFGPLSLRKALYLSLMLDAGL